MKLFYPDFESIHRLTLSLDVHQNELQCAHCLKNDQFISHGIVYKQRSRTLAEKVGKRLFCSNRYGRQGCGRTVQLYVATEIPSLRYGAAQLFVFISALLAKLNIHEAYHHATGQFEPRNAWRWLKRLMFKLSDYRSFLRSRKTVFSKPDPLPSSSHSLQHLLPTFDRLFTSTHNGCVDYQMARQRPFL